MQSSSKIDTQFLNSTTEKRRRVLEKIEKLPEDELQLIYQSLFKKEIIEGFDNLPPPQKILSEKELSAAMTKKRLENGFYK